MQKQQNNLNIILFAGFLQHCKNWELTFTLTWLFLFLFLYKFRILYFVFFAVSQFVFEFWVSLPTLETATMGHTLLALICRAAWPFTTTLRERLMRWPQRQPSGTSRHGGSEPATASQHVADANNNERCDSSSKPTVALATRGVRQRGLARAQAEWDDEYLLVVVSNISRSFPIKLSKNVHISIYVYIYI